MADQNIPSVYDPHEVEQKWYDYWTHNNYFHAEVDKSKKPFSIVIPPPNVTGFLHLGHALDNTLQDILVRWRRMQGYNTVWIPGTDHAGIATQVKVEEHISKEGLTRYDLGRERFLERVWDWKERFGGTIISQLKRLGASCDWSRERFTMDEGCSTAVREVFERLYNEGLIYQGNRIINWCIRCHTALSDIEVEYSDNEGALHHIKYPFEDGSGFVTIATTRPETMLGDVAVAVNPKDERYQGLIGKMLVLPVVGRKIPLIADDYADPQFGTGAVKVTPAHDPNDFEIGIRHNLEQIVVIADDGTMNANAGSFAGLDRYECRRRLIELLKETGNLVRIEKHIHAVGHCQRCDTVVEPLLSKQWFVKMKPLAEPAIKAVLDGKIRFIPERFTKVYLNWLENIHDWCISRQLWWGHRIPVWYCSKCGKITVSKQDPEACPECGDHSLKQDPDVLDTWFSSALWPFSTQGWPEINEELGHFYPTSVLVTGYDIIFFWVARMIFMGLKFMGDVPFHNVFIHGLVRDGEGRKMSKSSGNAVDPVGIIDEYGADTLRFTLVTGNTPGNDMRFHQEKVEGSRNFANKIWNASRFVLMNLGGFNPEGIDIAGLELSLEDRWILSRSNKVVDEVTRLLERFDLGEAARTIYDFIWSEYCDWYIEMVKSRLKGSDDDARLAARACLWFVLDRVLKLLHPFMPFITEGIWQYLPHVGESIMVAKWPEPTEGLYDDETETKMNFLMDAIKAIRNIRAEMNVPPGKKVSATILGSGGDCEFIASNAEMIKNLAGISDLEISTDVSGKPEKAVSAIIGGIEIYLPLSGLIDIDKEIERLEKEIANLDKEVERLNSKLSNEGFIAKAPPEVVEKERAKLADYQAKKEKIVERLIDLK